MFKIFEIITILQNFEFFSYSFVDLVYKDRNQTVSKLIPKNRYIYIFTNIYKCPHAHIHTCTHICTESFCENCIN